MDPATTTDHPPLPVARPVPVEAVTGSDVGGAWARAFGWVLGTWACAGLVWWLTDVDAFYAAVVATTALGALGEGPLTVRRVGRHLGYAVGLAVVGGVVLGALDVGLGVGQRVVLGACGVLGAGVVLLVVAAVRRRTAPPVG